MKKNVIYVILLIFTSLSLFPLSVNIRSYDHAAFTRVVFESDRGFEFKIDPSSDYALDLKLKKKVEVSRDIEVFRRSALVDRVVHRWEDGNSVFRVHMKSGFKMKRNFVLERPFRVVLDLEKSPVVSKSQKPPIPNPEPEQKTNQEPPQDPGKDNQNGQDNEQSNGENETQDEGQEDDAADETGKEKPSLPNQPKKRPLIDTICIDPGHGGTDLGAVGPSKIPEKNITLDIGKKVKRMIVSKLGLSVVMTRESDEEVSLNSRVSKANNRKAQLFVSIHANSSFRRSARGPETFFVSLKATDKESFRLSQKENSSFEEIGKLTQDDDLKMILWSMAQSEYIKESSKLADFIQYELNTLMSTRNRGVKQAPFRVLMRAAMPAVLVEIGFISNRREEQKLKDDAFKSKVAGAIYNGISKYIYYHNNLYRQ